ncbi:MAG: restriction endonuclease [Marmoricola sp.]|nr:restriction endonuclease [Marmoricola sp.]
MTRAVEEWIGRTDDQKVPPRVRQRVFDREGGVCHITGKAIAPGDLWDLDHKVALILGGQHRESNLFPALREPHRRKTAVEMAIKSKIAKVRQKHLGIKKSKSSLSNQLFKRCMDGTVINRRTGEIVS